MLLWSAALALSGVLILCVRRNLLGVLAGVQPIVLGGALAFVSGTRAGELVKHAGALAFFIVLMGAGLVVAGWIFVGVLQRETAEIRVQHVTRLKEDE